MKRQFYRFFVCVFLLTSVACNKKIIFSNRNGVYTAKLGQISFGVSAKDAGRIISFRYGQEEMLLQREVEPEYYGSTFWLSPQEWHWPPYPVLDKWSYNVTLKRKMLKLLSPLDTINGIEIVKEFAFSKDKAVLITYCLKNISNKEKRMAPWDVTRVLKGITFFPIGEPSKANRSFISKVCKRDDILWYETEEEHSPQKLFSTAREGWLAHYRNGILMVKCFPDILPEQLPPGHGEVEIFVASQGKYVELENHGEYVTLEPGESLQYKEKWFLLTVNPEVIKEKENLLNIVRKLNKNVP